MKPVTLYMSSIKFCRLLDFYFLTALMLVLDQIKPGDRKLQAVAMVILAGLLVLLAGVWQVQVLNGKKYAESQRNQSYRTVRLSAIRGKILDRNGAPLAENKPSYGLYVYLENLRQQFKQEYLQARRAILKAQLEAAEKESWVQQLLVKVRLRKSKSPAPGLTRLQAEALGRKARYQVVSNLTFQVSQFLSPPLILSEPAFRKHYADELALPMPVLDKLSPRQIAKFSERSTDFPGVELEFQPLRSYPHGNVAAHVLGYLSRDKNYRDPDEDASYNYHLPDFRGRSGLEAVFDTELRGKPGRKSMLVNNLGYREHETVWVNPQAGRNVVLTLDLALQKAAEASIRLEGAEVCGAVVVMDVRNGDVLAMVSSPSYDPNRFMAPISQKDWVEQFDDPKLTQMFNRATFGKYPPGSIFKIVTALASMEAGVLEPTNTLHNPGYYQFPNRRSRPINDTAPEGMYDFLRAFKRSSNTYFIIHGLQARAERLVEMGQRFGLGLKTGVPVFAESAGDFPTVDQTRQASFEQHTALMSIGQGPISVTPLQMAVMTSAVANNGKVFKPRMVSRIETQTDGEPHVVKDFPSSQLFGTLGVQEKHLQWVREAMRADVMDRAEGSGFRAEVPGMEVCGKTGTAEVKSGAIVLKKVTWFVSFAPLSQPRYAVVVMVDEGGSGGKTCAPIAKRIYESILKMERSPKGPFSAADPVLSAATFGP